jgi:hypothetical protein
MACRKDILETAKLAGGITTTDEKNTAKKKCIGTKIAKEIYWNNMERYDYVLSKDSDG